jgi:alpha-L-fucosidase
LLGIGEWLGKYGESIYGTRGGPYKPGTWGGSTRKGNKVYLHVMQKINDGKLELPALPAKVNNCRILTKGSVSVRNRDNLVVTLNKEAADPEIYSIVELELDKNAMDIKPIDTDYSGKSFTADARVSASSQAYDKTSPEAVVYHSELEDITSDYRILIRNTNKGLPIPEELKKLRKWNFTPRERGFRLRYWRAAEDDKNPTLEIHLGNPVTFSKTKIMEKFNRIRSFTLQYMENDEWKTYYEGKRMNFFSLKHDPITAQKVRLIVSETEGGGPAIKMFDLY